MGKKLRLIQDFLICTVMRVNEATSDFQKLREALASLTGRACRCLRRYLWGATLTGRGCRWLMRCLWGATLSANEKGKTGTEAVAALLGIVFLSTAALLAAVQEVGRTQPEFVWLYVFATAIPLIVMGTVLQTAHRTRKRRSDKKCHFFDVGTVRFTRSVLAMSFILWGVSSYLGFVGLLPVASATCLSTSASG